MNRPPRREISLLVPQPNVSFQIWNALSCRGQTVRSKFGTNSSHVPKSSFPAWNELAPETRSKIRTNWCPGPTARSERGTNSSDFAPGAETLATGSAQLGVLTRLDTTNKLPCSTQLENCRCNANYNSPFQTDRPTNRSTNRQFNRPTNRAFSHLVFQSLSRVGPRQSWSSPAGPLSPKQKVSCISRPMAGERGGALKGRSCNRRRPPVDLAALRLGHRGPASRACASM